jgi:hypothetical protein
MFDLERAIAEWRQHMLAAGIKTPAPLEELESHLREEIEQRVKAGVGEQQAFKVAIQKIGKGEMLKNEFTKVEEAKGAGDYKLLQILSVAYAVLVPLWFGGMALSNRGGFSELASGQRMSCAVAAAMSSLLIWSGRLSYRFLPVIRSKLIRGAILVPLMFWWIFFLNFITPHYGFTRGQFTEVSIWGLITPGGAFIGLMWGLETAVRKPSVIPD